jgi:hypothetical protein
MRLQADAGLVAASVAIYMLTVGLGSLFWGPMVIYKCSCKKGEGQREMTAWWMPVWPSTCTVGLGSLF